MRFSKRVSSRKQGKSRARMFTSPAADWFAAAMQFVKLHLYFCTFVSHIRVVFGVFVLRIGLFQLPVDMPSFLSALALALRLPI